MDGRCGDAGDNPSTHPIRVTAIEVCEVDVGCGTGGFDVFRWNWITYHVNAQPIQCTVRWVDTLETIAFDWKVSLDNIAGVYQLIIDAQLTPGQVITLPVPLPS